MVPDFCHTCFADLAPGETCSRCGQDRSSTAEIGDVLPRGSILAGKYKVGRVLGRGGFGATYLAWDMNLQVRVAIKEFLPRQFVTRKTGGIEVRPYTNGEEAFSIGLEQFLTEARILAQFRNHLGIISVLDFFPENGTGYLVMEYLAGSTLEQYIAAKDCLDFEEALQLLTPVADALRACHSAGLIHRDISPDNIFLTSDGGVKLLDFGAARFAIGQHSTDLSVILKEGYAPFEQYQQTGHQGPWTDIYALTATLYRLLTGELPVTAPDRLAGTPLPTPSERGIEIPASLQALLTKGMAIRAEQRYRTVEAFLSDLHAVLGRSNSLQFTIRPERPPAVPADPHPQWKLVIKWKLVIAIVGSLGLVCSIGTAAAYFAGVFSGPASRPPPVPPDARMQPPAASLEQANILGPQQSAVAPLAVPTQPPNPPVPTEQPNLPAQPPSTPPRSSSIGSMRLYVRHAAEYQVRLMQILLQSDKLLNTINKRKVVSSQVNSLNIEELTYDSLLNEQDKDVDKYVAQIVWLAANDDTSVKAAVKLEQDAANKLTVNKEDASFNAQVSSAIDLLTNHLRLYRQGHLTRDAIIADMSRSIKKPPQQGPRKTPPKPIPRPAPSDQPDRLDAIIQELLNKQN